MSQAVAPQMDVGSFSLRGLTLVAPLLAVISSDNVSPTAVVQMENLGALFHINGEYAMKVPTLLQRSKSIPLDRLGVAVGWRKGDTASIMAQTAGGQALALLSLWLVSLYPRVTVASILYDLSEKALPKALSVSSPSQLADVAELLASKLAVLGLGNIIAQQVLKIHSVYEQLTTKVPYEMLQPLTLDAMVEFLYSVSKALCEEGTIVRISGTQGMGYVVALVLVMFPLDTTFIIEGLVIQEGTRRSIILDLGSTSTSSGTVMIQTETKLSSSIPGTLLPIDIGVQKTEYSFSAWTFKWSRHLADALQLVFTNFGLKCSPELYLACCNLMVLLPSITNISGNVILLLGSEPLQRIHHVCRTILGFTPSNHPINPHIAFEKLVHSFLTILGTDLNCTCESCHIFDGWEVGPRGFRADQECIVRFLWVAVGKSLHHALLCLFIEARPDASVTLDLAHSHLYLDSPVLEAINSVVRYTRKTHIGKNRSLHSRLLGMLLPPGIPSTKALVISQESSTMYPASIPQLQIDLDEGIRYYLCDGQLVFKGRYYTDLESVPGKRRERTEKSLFNHEGRVCPMSLGVHDDLFITVRETVGCLELRIIISYFGQSIQCDLTEIVEASLHLRDCHPCDHPPSTELDKAHHNDILTVSLATPRAAQPKIAIVQTKGNKTAQFLACVGDDKNSSGFEHSETDDILLARHCCLNCAVREAKTKDIKQIIVA